MKNGRGSESPSPRYSLQLYNCCDSLFQAFTVCWIRRRTDRLCQSFVATSISDKETNIITLLLLVVNNKLKHLLSNSVFVLL